MAEKRTCGLCGTETAILARHWEDEHGPDDLRGGGQ
jgi:hypothetical protein